METNPIAGMLGLEISGIDLKKSKESEWRAIHGLFLEHSVLVFRDQKLEPQDIMDVGAKFGPPCHYPFVTGMDGFPFIFEVVKEAGEKINFGGNWHTDTSYLPQPPLGTLLYAVETPTHGGDTLLTNTRAAYEALSAGMRATIDPLIGVFSAGLKHSGGRAQIHAQDKVGGMKIHGIDKAEEYEAEHPVVRTHPDTGRKALYCSRSHTVRFKNMSEEESRPIIDFLQAHQIRPEFTCRVRWAPGTLTVWDNRCTQHNAINDYHGQRRRMRRLTVGPQTPR